MANSQNKAFLSGLDPYHAYKFANETKPLALGCTGKSALVVIGIAALVFLFTEPAAFLAVLLIFALVALFPLVTWGIWNTYARKKKEEINKPYRRAAMTAVTYGVSLIFFLVLGTLLNKNGGGNNMAIPIVLSTVVCGLLFLQALGEGSRWEEKRRKQAETEEKDGNAD